MQLISKSSFAEWIAASTGSGAEVWPPPFPFFFFSCCGSCSEPLASTRRHSAPTKAAHWRTLVAQERVNRAAAREKLTFGCCDPAAFGVKTTAPEACDDACRILVCTDESPK